jgi:hypothetical protein
MGFKYWGKTLHREVGRPQSECGLRPRCDRKVVRTINFRLISFLPIDGHDSRQYAALVMSKEDLDQLRLAYKKAVDEWVDAIHSEEALATPDHSMVAMEHWDAAHLTEHGAHAKATDAREAYKDALRSVNYGI